MSSNAYTLKIAIDDSKIKDLEKRLMAIMSGNALGGANPLPVGGQGGGGDKSGMMKNIAKLGMIATGVTGVFALVQKLVSMTIQASPMLQQMLKLFNFGIMLIFRPIGDFFGFFLRPLIIYFLRSVALPFYREWRPILQKLGAFLGDQLADDLEEAGSHRTSPFEEDWSPISNFKAVLLEFAALANAVDGNKNAFESMKLWIHNMETDFKPVYSFFAKLNSGFTGLITSATTNFDTWGTTLTSWLTAFNPGQYLVQQVVSWIAKLNLPNWDDITTKFTEFKEALSGVFDAIKVALFAFIEKITLGLVDLRDDKSKGNTTNTQNNFIDINGNGKDDFEEFGGILSDWLKGDK